MYLWGRHFTLRTDHSALQTLLSPNFSGRAGARIARWQARLLPYAYTVTYVPGRRLTPAADALSRMPIPAEADLPAEDPAEEVIALLTDEVGSVLTGQEVRAASAADPEMQQLRQQIKNGWPSDIKSCPPEVQPYFKLRHELSIRRDDIVLRGAQQVDVPVQMRRK